MSFLDKLFWTSDPHIGHTNVIKHCNRPFPNTYEHDVGLLQNWNSVVPHDGIVYVLGDFFWYKKSVADYISQLNGKIYFIKGNHDKAMKGESLKYVESLGDYHELTVQDPDIKGGKQLIVMSHYPIESWNRKHWGSWHLHGHAHGNSSLMRNRLDVGVDVWKYTPVSYHQIKEYFLSQAW